MSIWIKRFYAVIVFTVLPLNLLIGYAHGKSSRSLDPKHLQSVTLKAKFFEKEITREQPEIVSSVKAVRVNKNEVLQITLKQTRQQWLAQNPRFKGARLWLKRWSSLSKLKPAHIKLLDKNGAVIVNMAG